jgi:hypothetical protein
MWNFGSTICIGRQQPGLQRSDPLQQMFDQFQASRPLRQGVHTSLTMTSGQVTDEMPSVLGRILTASMYACKWRSHDGC